MGGAAEKQAGEALGLGSGYWSRWSEEVEIITKVRELRALGDTRGADRVVAQLLEKHERLLEHCAYRMQARWGSLSLEDLLQVGRLEVAKAIDSFDIGKRRSFAVWAYLWARRAMLHEVRLHSADVRPSDGAQRGRVKKAGIVSVQMVELADPQSAPRVFNQHASEERENPDVYDRLDPVPLADEQLDAEQMRVLVRKFLHRLPRHMADLIRKAHGIGGVNPMSVRDIAETTGQNRARLTAELKRGEQLLGAMILRETSGEIRPHLESDE